MNGKTGWFAAGILSALVVGGLIPSVGWFIDSFNEPSEEQVDLIEQRQQIVLQTLPVIQERLETLEMQVEALLVVLREHSQDVR